MRRSIPTFLVLAHSDPLLFKRLVGRLRNVGNVVAHIDRKVDEADYRVDGVHYVAQRIDIKWAGYSMVLATLELMRLAILLFPQSSHMVLLSGACYPMVSDEALCAYFEKKAGVNLIRLYDVGANKTHFWHHMNRYHLRDIVGGRGSGAIPRGVRVCLEYALNFFGRRFPDGLIPYAGSQWWALTPLCCGDILKEIQSNSLYRSSYWRWVFAPDEIFFHTLVGNVVGAQDTLGIVSSPYHKDTASFHLIHSSLSKIYDMSDVEEIESSLNRGYVFIRKMDSVKSADLLTYLDGRKYGSVDFI